jgi:hypothetical protein
MTATRSTLERRICANCGIEFTWAAVSGAGGAVFCCTGCRDGGPCTCDYAVVWERMAAAARAARAPSASHRGAGGRRG